jgi:hypothetical protein
MAVGLAVVLSGCAKLRDAIFPDAVKSQVVELAKVQGAKMQVRATSEIADGNFDRVLGEDRRGDDVVRERMSDADSYTGPEELRLVMRGVKVLARASETVALTAKVTRGNVTVYQQVDPKSVQSVLRALLDDGNLLPVFQVPVMN